MTRRDDPTADDAAHHVLEIHRQHAAGTPHEEFRFGAEGYSVRGQRGAVRDFQLDWSQHLVDDLHALRTAPRPEQIAQKLGTRLRDSLGPADWAREEQAIFDAAARAYRVHVTVRLGAAELYAFPWELLTHSTTGQHLGELDNLLVRYEWPGTTSKPRTREYTSEHPGRILMAWSAAGGRVPSDQHIQAITSATAGHKAPRYTFGPDRDVLAEVSREALDEALCESPEPVAILHLLCHGTAASEGYGLCLSDGLGQCDVVDAAQLRRILVPHAGTLRLVVLCACDGANMGTSGNHLGGVAQNLHRAGIECVVASRYPMSPGGSLTLAKALYRQIISRDASYEESFLTARNRLSRAGSTRDWIALQLFSRPDDAFDQPPTPLEQRTDATHKPLSRWEYRLDRTPQWGPFKKLCVDSQGSVMVLLQGHLGQDIDLFCGRIERYLVRECRERPHRVCRLRFRQERNTPVLAEDWEERLCLASQYGAYDPFEALQELTRERPAVLILGDAPLHDLSDREIRALVEFVGTSLPGLIQRLGPKSQPVRVLVPIAHRRAPGDGLDDELVQTVLAALGQAGRSGIAIDMLEELTFPKWPEVAKQLIGELGSDRRELLRECRAVYDQLAKEPPETQNFEQLARAIGATLAANQSRNT